GCLAIDLLVGFPEAFQRSIDQVLAVVRLHGLESIMDPLNVPLLVDHDFGKRLLHDRWDLFNLAVPRILVNDTLFEYLRDGEYLHHVAWRPGSSQVLVLISRAQPYRLGSERVDARGPMPRVNGFVGEMFRHVCL